jgi:hypothetical protein
VHPSLHLVTTFFNAKASVVVLPFTNGLLRNHAVLCIKTFDIEGVQKRVNFQCFHFIYFSISNPSLLIQHLPSNISFLNIKSFINIAQASGAIVTLVLSDRQFGRFQIFKFFYTSGNRRRNGCPFPPTTSIFLII